MSSVLMPFTETYSVMLVQFCWRGTAIRTPLSIAAVLQAAGRGCRATSFHSLPAAVQVIRYPVTRAWGANLYCTILQSCRTAQFYYTAAVSLILHQIKVNWTGIVRIKDRQNLPNLTRPAAVWTAGQHVQGPQCNIRTGGSIFSQYN